MKVVEFIKEWDSIIFLIGGIIWFVIWAINAAHNSSFIHKLYKRVDELCGRTKELEHDVTLIKSTVYSDEVILRKVENQVNEVKSIAEGNRRRLDRLYALTDCCKDICINIEKGMEYLDSKYELALKKINKRMRKNESNRCKL